MCSFAINKKTTVYLQAAFQLSVGWKLSFLIIYSWFISLMYLLCLCDFFHSCTLQIKIMCKRSKEPMCAQSTPSLATFQVFPLMHFQLWHRVLRPAIERGRLITQHDDVAASARLSALASRLDRDGKVSAHLPGPFHLKVSCWRIMKFTNLVEFMYFVFTHVSNESYHSCGFCCCVLATSFRCYN